MDINNNSFILTISYGNYATGVGGTDKAILSQSRIFLNENISTIHLFPKMGVRQKKPKIMWGIIVDEQYYACLDITQIVNELKLLIDCGKKLKATIIHHLQWVNLEDVDFLLGQINSKIFFYLHDYMSVCPYGGLIYNKKYFCGVDRPSDAKCEGCSFYSEKALNRIKIIDDLFDSMGEHLTIIAPSEIAAKIWLESHINYSDRVVVLNHQKPVGSYIGNLQPKDDREAIKIAFVGYQSDIKGWPQWIDAVKKAKEHECHYEFFQFGTVNDHFDFIKEVEIDFKKSLTAMTDALRANKIDIAVLWSIWPETYSYTYYESFASNCFVLTNDESGNIKEQVRINGNGIVYSDTGLTDVLLDEQTLRIELNRFRKKQIFGPEQLVDNDEILKLVESKE